MKKKIRTIQSDLYRYNGLSGKVGLIKGFIKYEGFRYTYFLRKIQQHKRYSMCWFIYKVFLRHYRYKYGFQIPDITQIGNGFYIGHFGNIVINPKTIIGKNCNVAHGVTIGQANRGKQKGVPIIGNNVWIGTGAVIVGKIIIGDNVLIAPNSYINIDIPSNSLVIGNPCKVIPKENPCEGYIEYECEQ